MRRLSATIPCLLMAALVVGCTEKLPCRHGTIFVAIDARAAMGSDRLRVDVTVGSQVLHGIHAFSGQPSTSVEVTFPNGFPAGRSISVTITAFAGPSEVAQGNAVATLDDSCSHLSIALSRPAGERDLGDIAASDLGDIGASVVGDLGARVCNLSPDDCPAGSYCNGTVCVAGCKSDVECQDDGGVGTCCNARCVNTLTDSQNCNGCGNVCSSVHASTVTCSGGVCGWTCVVGYAHCSAGNTGCETNLAPSMEKICGASCVSSTSCCGNSDCTTPPTPASCYAGICSGVGGSCTYSLKTGSKVCGSICCNAINGTCNANCSLTCASGFFDCDGDASNGCESTGPSSGQGCCTGTSPSSTGTPIISHDNGFGGTYWDCYPRGAPGQSSTYNAQMAFDAASSYSAQSGTATSGWVCGTDEKSICKTAGSGTSGSCTCWDYAGPMAGRVRSSTTMGCDCIQSTDPTWN